MSLLSVVAVEGLLYLAPACSFWLLVGCYVWELTSMVEEGAFEIMADNPVLFMTAGVLGFGVNVLSLCVIRLGSGLTLKVPPVTLLHIAFNTK
jgi:hypothetical protein